MRDSFRWFHAHLRHGHCKTRDSHPKRDPMGIKTSAALHPGVSKLLDGTEESGGCGGQNFVHHLD